MASRAACSVLGACALLLAACSSPATLDSAEHLCASGARHVEVELSGRVDRVLGERSGRSGEHEGFILQYDPGAAKGRSIAATYAAQQYRRVRVEDNVDITGPIALHWGDTVQVVGQYECNDGVIHWTHHDPRGRHPSGYIRVNGKLYE